MLNNSDARFSRRESGVTSSFVISEVWGPPEVLQFLSASIRKYDDVFLSNQFKAIAHSALSPE